MSNNRFKFFNILITQMSLANNGVVKGLNDVVKALDHKEALLHSEEDCEVVITQMLKPCWGYTHPR